MISGKHVFALRIGNTKHLVKQPTALEAYNAIRAKVGWHIAPPNPNEVRQLDGPKETARLIVY